MIVLSELEADFPLLIQDFFSFPFLQARIWMCPEPNFDQTEKDDTLGDGEAGDILAL